MKTIHFPGRFLLFILTLHFSASPAAAADQIPAFSIVSSSFLGAKDFSDAVVGAVFRSDGKVVLAANVGCDIQVDELKVEKQNEKRGVVVLLSESGDKILSFQRVAETVHDIALDGKNNLYVASGDDGVIKLSPDMRTVLWKKQASSSTRIDVTDDGAMAVLSGKKVLIFNPEGEGTGTAPGKGYTCDVCIDGTSKTVVICGFRNAHAWEGKRTYPVQICYIHGFSFSGERKWRNYDWSTDRDSDRFLNKPTNNMADSRADRCAIGNDGKLYVTFQVAGGNHIFRYSPKDIMKKVPIAGGDKYHRFYNSRAEHKCFFARYEPATGEYFMGQQFCGRLSSGRANAVVTKTGAITADKRGNVYVVGKAAYGLPLNLNPDEKDYTGGGFLLVMSSDLKRRLLCTRTQAGKGSSHAVDACIRNGCAFAVYGGSKMQPGMFVQRAVQKEAADTEEGFFVVLRGVR